MDPIKRPLVAIKNWERFIDKKVQPAVTLGLVTLCILRGIPLLASVVGIGLVNLLIDGAQKAPRTVVTLPREIRRNWDWLAPAFVSGVGVLAFVLLGIARISVLWAVVATLYTAALFYGIRRFRQWRASKIPAAPLPVRADGDAVLDVPFTHDPS